MPQSSHAIPSNIVSIKGLPEALTRDSGKVRVLGKVLMWAFAGIEMPRDEFVQRWEQAGLDPTYVPRIRTRTTVLRTMHALELAGFTRRIVETQDEAIWVLVGERIDAAAQDVEFEKTSRLVYDKKAKTLTVSNPHFQPSVDALMARFCDLLQTSDVRTAVLDTVKDAGCIAMRDRGGVYFVPPQRFDLLDRLQALCASLPPGSAALNLYNLFDSQGDRESLQIFKAFEAEFLGDLEEMARRLAGLEGVVLDGNTATLRVSGPYAHLVAGDGVDFSACGITAGDTLVMRPDHGGTFEFTIRDVIDGRQLLVNNSVAVIEGCFTVEREVDTRSRNAMWANRLREYDAQRQKVAMFAELLAFESQQYMERIDELETRVRKYVTGA